MTTEQAIEVLTEMQKWRRSEPPYDEAACEMPYDPKKWGEAVDLGIEAMKQLAKNETDQMIYEQNHATPEDYERVLKMSKKDIIAAILVYRDVRTEHPSWLKIDKITAEAMKSVSKSRTDGQTEKDKKV